MIVTKKKKIFQFIRESVKTILFLDTVDFQSDSPIWELNALNFTVGVAPVEVDFYTENSLREKLVIFYQRVEEKSTKYIAHYKSEMKGRGSASMSVLQLKSNWS